VNGKVQAFWSIACEHAAGLFDEREAVPRRGFYDDEDDATRRAGYRAAAGTGHVTVSRQR